MADRSSDARRHVDTDVAGNGRVPPDAGRRPRRFWFRADRMRAYPYSSGAIVGYLWSDKELGYDASDSG
jgi:hypothetical protein